MFYYFLFYALSVSTATITATATATHLMIQLRTFEKIHSKEEPYWFSGSQDVLTFHILEYLSQFKSFFYTTCCFLLGSIKREIIE